MDVNNDWLEDSLNNVLIKFKKQIKKEVLNDTDIKNFTKIINTVIKLKEKTILEKHYNSILKTIITDISNEQ